MKVVKRFNDRVSLYLRVRVNGKQHIKAVWLNKQELKPVWGFLDGKPTECSSGVYHLRYRAAGKRIWEGDCGRFARHPPKSARVGLKPTMVLSKAAFNRARDW